MDEQLEFVKPIAERLDGAGVPYMMTGSMAMAVYAVPRMTRDIDRVVELRPTDAEKFADLFEPDCLVDVDAIREAAAEQGMFNIFHKEWLIKVDFITRKNDPYRKTEFERRQTIEVEGVPVSFRSRSHGVPHVFNGQILDDCRHSKRIRGYPRKRDSAPFIPASVWKRSSCRISASRRKISGIAQTTTQTRR